MIDPWRQIREIGTLGDGTLMHRPAWNHLLWANRTLGIWIWQGPGAEKSLYLKFSRFQLDHPTLERIADQRIWLESPYSIISSGVTAEEERIAEKIRNASVSLNEIADIKYGLKAYQEGKGNPKQTREQVNRKAFTSQERRTPDFAPFLEGREIYRYENEWDENNWGTIALSKDRWRNLGRLLHPRTGLQQHIVICYQGYNS